MQSPVLPLASTRDVLRSVRGTLKRSEVSILPLKGKQSLTTVFRDFLVDEFRGRRVHLDEMRAAVKKKYPDLCNEAVMCRHENPTRTEWDHRLRDALTRLKKAKMISQAAGDDRTGWYTFP